MKITIQQTSTKRKYIVKKKNLNVRYEIALTYRLYFDTSSV